MCAAVGNYVEVYIWRGRNSYGEMTTSSESITAVNIKGSPITGLERCGHTSACIFEETLRGRNIKTTTHYISLWPGGDGKGYLQQNLQHDIISERGLPDVIVRLQHLNNQRMIDMFIMAKAKVANGTLTWTLIASDDANIVSGSTTANCASFVWFFLKVGGIDKPEYSKTLNYKGPRDTEFYNKVKCNIGRRLWGLGDGWIWTRKFLTPYALSLRVASAAEAYDDDKAATIAKMNNPHMVDREVEARTYSAINTAGVREGTNLNMNRGASPAISTSGSTIKYLVGNLFLTGVGIGVGTFCLVKLCIWGFNKYNPIENE